MFLPTRFLRTTRSGIRGVFPPSRSNPSLPREPAAFVYVPLRVCTIALFVGRAGAVHGSAHASVNFPVRILSMRLDLLVVPAPTERAIVPRSAVPCIRLSPRCFASALVCGPCCRDDVFNRRRWLREPGNLTVRVRHCYGHYEQVKLSISGSTRRRTIRGSAVAPPRRSRSPLGKRTRTCRRAPSFHDQRGNRGRREVRVAVTLPPSRPPVVAVRSIASRLERAASRRQVRESHAHGRTSDAETAPGPDTRRDVYPFDAVRRLVDPGRQLALTAEDQKATNHTHPTPRGAQALSVGYLLESGAGSALNASANCGRLRPLDSSFLCSRLRSVCRVGRIWCFALATLRCEASRQARRRHSVRRFGACPWSSPRGSLLLSLSLSITLPGRRHSRWGRFLRESSEASTGLLGRGEARRRAPTPEQSRAAPSLALHRFSRQRLPRAGGRTDRVRPAAVRRSTPSRSPRPLPCRQRERSRLPARRAQSR